uniref:Uncharacterized protein n=1 Tax=Arundo donax TaxID=35708 RepID=A0A0A8XPB5_ARUDO
METGKHGTPHVNACNYVAPLRQSPG